MELAARHSVYWSQEHYRVFGFDPEEGIRQTKHFTSAFIRRIERGCGEQFLLEGKTKAPSSMWITYRSSWRAIKYIRRLVIRFLTHPADIIEYFGAARDMTEQHEARAALETAFEQ